jgi:hypothetical protein
LGNPVVPPSPEQTPATPAPAAPPADFVLKPPEGQVIGSEAVDAFAKLAKEKGLTSEVAQAVLNEMAPVLQAQSQRVADQLVAEARTYWEGQLKADPQIGGAKFDENLAIAQKAVALGPPELKDLLNSTGLGSHPAVFRWALEIGRKISQDTFVPAGPPPANEKSLAQRIFQAHNPTPQE